MYPAKHEPSQLTTTNWPRSDDFVTDFVAVISSQSEGLGKMALGILKIYLESPFSANRHCPRSVCLRSVVVDPPNIAIRSFHRVTLRLENLKRGRTGPLKPATRAHQCRSSATWGAFRDLALPNDCLCPLKWGLCPEEINRLGATGVQIEA